MQKTSALVGPVNPLPPDLTDEGTVTSENEGRLRLGRDLPRLGVGWRDGCGDLRRYHRGDERELRRNGNGSEAVAN